MTKKFSIEIEGYNEEDSNTFRVPKISVSLDCDDAKELNADNVSYKAYSVPVKAIAETWTGETETEFDINVLELEGGKLAICNNSYIFVGEHSTADLYFSEVYVSKPKMFTTEVSFEDVVLEYQEL